MTTWNPRANELFLKALELPTEAERQEYLDGVCAGDAALRAEVDALLQANAGAGGFLESPASGSNLPATIQEPIREQHGTMIGQYKLMEQIGEGGMGTVWMAQQTEPVKRVVALKLIKPGMDSKQIIARFEAERQALAIMDHANIARVLDAGTTSAGRPYFVMDLVKGVPITKYCDEHRLTPRLRLELFIPVCQAVQHAHQKGIIHRDLKPSNVLVALYDGKPVPKVIDFGVAKAAGQSLTDKTLVTGFGNIVGTLEYMSPEQAEINQLDIDTRSDIYSLGVLLYELLTGSPPFSKKELEKVGMLEMLRVIREEEPTKPSTKLSTAEGLPTLAANRSTEPAKLTKLLRGELDWIVMKALEKDRNRRYETANGFAMDVQRYLADEPVQACPPSAGYRLRKFVRRNKGAVLAASLVVLALVGGVIGTSIGLYQAEEARSAEEVRAEKEAAAKRDADNQRDTARRAAEAERLAAEAAGRAQKKAELATQQAMQRLAQIEKGVELFAGLLRKLDPRAEVRGGPPLYDQLRQRAVEAADELVEESVGDAEAMARLQTLLGNALLDLGEPRKAMELLKRARATRQARLGPEHPDTLTTLNSLAGAYLKTGEVSQAIALFQQLHDTNVKKRGANHPDTLAALGNLAATYLTAGRAPEAIDLYKQIRNVQEKMLQADDPLMLNTLNSLAVAYQKSGKLPEAIALLAHVRNAQVKKLGPDHASTLSTLNNLARAYHAAGRLSEAIALFEKVRDARVKKLGVEHPATLTTMDNLACALQ
ncbi:MAG TPA: tetratricopeptide repeat protein, partial [Gemmataceae bacterium]|nr:tetratricopeptide repeat protein [Gemmataceae bacterium]